MRSSDKDGVSTDAVHVDACASLNVIQMNIAVLGDQVQAVILGAKLKQTRAVIYKTMSNFNVHCMYARFHFSSILQISLSSQRQIQICHSILIGVLYNTVQD